MEEITKHYLISGRVQGVGFRAFTARAATELSLCGWVRNLADGRVEALARGTEVKLDAFLAKLKTGPQWGRVESVQVTLADPAGDEGEEFTVRKDGAEPCCEK